MNEKEQSISLACFHCGNDCLDTALKVNEKIFCCQGCMTVYGIIHQNDLDYYYCLNSTPGQTVKHAALEKWEALNHPVTASNYISFKDDKLTKSVFYLPQIHCSSCIWLLEHLPTLNKGILFSEVNFTNKKIYISFNTQAITLAEIAALLESIGYEPYLEKGPVKKPVKNKDGRIQIGMAGFCFANIMILSFPEYLGLSEASNSNLLGYFRWISLALSIPVFYISLTTFFYKAWLGIKNNILNIDLPIALAILVTFSRSVFEIGTGYGSGYLDSMSGIVFFMLLGRFLQDKTNHSLNFERNFTSYFPLYATIRNKLQVNTIPVSSIQPDDILILKYGELVPVDGILSKGNAKIDYSYITGESEYQTISTGQLLYAGGRVVESVIELIAVKSFSQSDFIQIWNKPAFQKTDEKKAEWTDAVSKYFTWVVLFIAFSGFLYWFSQGNIGLALNAMTATLIIACPCTLLLSATFTHGFMLNILSGAGIYFKNSTLFAKMLKINHIVFDKTGTLTYRLADRVKLVYSSWNKEEKEIALKLISYTNHPIAKSIIDFEKFYDSELKIKDFKEIEGSGIEGWVNDQYFKIGNYAFTGQQKIKEDESALYIIRDGQCIAIYSLQYFFKSGIISLLNRLAKYKLTLLSGDKNQSQSTLFSALPAGMMVRMGNSPQDKMEYIQVNQESGSFIMMVGDGLNDAGALKQSDVGVAIASDHFSFTPASDIIINESNLNKLDALIRLGHSVRMLILLSFAYSLVYNGIGIALALTGGLKPVIAAILMPLSSMGVIGIAYLGTKIIQHKYLVTKI